MNRQAFHDAVRPLFGGSLKQSQVDGLRVILDEWESRPANDARWLAYMLATTQHETASTMQPIKEYGGDAYFHDRYDPKGKRPDIAKELGNTQPGDGVAFCGRGYVQVTGRRNYALLAAKTGEDLIGNPSIALRPAIAVRALFDGMAEGWFTGRKLADYFDSDSEDWRNARRIINGLDKADDIARLGQAYRAALRKAGV
jgi:hypothetical protein